jgi:anti-anti-sigma factor
MIEIAHEEEWVVVRLKGDIDLATAPNLRVRLNDLLSLGPENLRVDLAEVTFMDSSGLNVLAGAHKHAHEIGGQMVLVNVPDQIRRVLTMTGLDLLLAILPSAERCGDPTSVESHR